MKSPVPKTIPEVTVSVPTEGTPPLESKASADTFKTEHSGLEEQSVAQSKQSFKAAAFDDVFETDQVELINEMIGRAIENLRIDVTSALNNEIRNTQEDL